MANPLIEVQKYQVITSPAMSRSLPAAFVTGSALIVAFLAWIKFCAWINYHSVEQWVGLIVAVIFIVFQRISSSSSRTKLDLKAKGLDIKDSSMTALMPWDHLQKVELRQRSFSFFPNYVYFKFKTGRDVLILWDDVKDTMDSTTLISCVRTWAPHAKILGDAKLAKSESIATYTELWLKDMSTAGMQQRLRGEQSLQPGTCLSDTYKIERVLSGGGQGTAYLASVLPDVLRDDLPPDVVIKEYILPSNDRGMKKAKDGLTKEAAIMNRINHPQIVKLYDYFIEDMRGYFALEFINGSTLRQLVEMHGPASEKKTAEIGRALCDALVYLHTLTPPVIHGDVTPDNIMIEKSGGIKLMDFDASVELTRNKTNTVVGKHSYMSPEQFKGELTDSSDVYALGCTLNYLLTGRDPEPMTESVPARHAKVSEYMSDIVRNATKFDASLRTTDLLKMRRQLEQF